MKMRNFVAWFAYIYGAICLRGQGTFQNLGFESATLSPIPAGQFGGPVPIAQGLPAWTADLGGNSITQVLQNNLTLGNASVDILGPNWSFGKIIDGQYTVVLQPGVDPGGSGQDVSASISQTAVVPQNAESLEFKASVSGAFLVSLGGQNLSLTSIGTGPNYTIYGANIPLADDGQSEALTITALASANDPNYFDSFAFGASTVPEPSALTLIIIGALAFVTRRQIR